MEIRSGDTVYEAVIGHGTIRNLGALVSKKLRGTHCAVVTDSAIERLYADQVERSLTSAGIQTIRIAIPSGEQSKTLAQVAMICDQMLAAGLDRHSFVVGLGGGVIGDISGFVAAIFQRGILHVQIPTTLLAMVDSSIGGKTGVNTTAGKNLIGAVHLPAMVIDDIDVLKSLAEREFKQGFAEIIKHAVIADSTMFEELRESDISQWQPNDPSSEHLASLISRNIRIKSQIVETDELDRTGERAVLNFGHTVGHAIEQAGDYRRYLHGEAISLGMVAATHISVKHARFRPEDREAIVDVLQRFGLPTRLANDIKRDRIMDALKFDKKFEQGQIRFVLTPKLGSAYLSSEVTWDDIAEAVEAL